MIFRRHGFRDGFVGGEIEVVDSPAEPESMQYFAAVGICCPRRGPPPDFAQLATRVMAFSPGRPLRSADTFVCYSCDRHVPVNDIYEGSGWPDDDLIGRPSCALHGERSIAAVYGTPLHESQIGPVSYSWVCLSANVPAGRDAVMYDCDAKPLVPFLTREAMAPLDGDTGFRPSPGFVGMHINAPWTTEFNHDSPFQEQTQMSPFRGALRSRSPRGQRLARTDSPTEDDADLAESPK